MKAGWLCEAGRLSLSHFTERKIAIKLANRDVFNDPVQGGQYRHLWQNEAILAGCLNHPHLVGVCDAFDSDKQTFIVMGYVEGSNLVPYTKIDNLLPVSEVIEIAFKCCLAMDYGKRV
jgi:serine/threonine protein kinase